MVAHDGMAAARSAALRRTTQLIGVGDFCALIPPRSLEVAARLVTQWRMACTHCGGTTSETHDEDHPGLCCDCFDLSLGMPMDQLNAERAEKGRPPVRPWKCDRRVAFDDRQRALGNLLVDAGDCDWGAMTVADIEQQGADAGGTACAVHEHLEAAKQ